jgi:hypothetical protein
MVSSINGPVKEAMLADMVNSDDLCCVTELVGGTW